MILKKTMHLLMKMRDEDPDFVYSFQLDEDCKLTSLMWSSGYSRRMYSHFGDVVTFDTTYRTNIYNMPFGMFVGVNNHFQSVIFAGVLLTSEETASFAWAFEAFVEMMGGKAPVTMLTDQCVAMGVAIGQVLTETVHRWCKWHVLKKLVEVLGHLFSNEEFQDEFNKVVNHTVSIQEFEASWKQLEDNYGLVGHPEMKRAYKGRSMWAKPWFLNDFCARMTSTQRSESANNVLKRFVPRNSPLNLFVQQYTKLVSEQ
uniref:Protein FAR1-RELATED SEQUENCE n=1 Tax=Arundo donax TaxID=35708 RepID=A0A0A9GEA7_ARUDO